MFRSKTNNTRSRALQIKKEQEQLDNAIRIANGALKKQRALEEENRKLIEQNNHLKSRLRDLERKQTPSAKEETKETAHEHFEPFEPEDPREKNRSLIWL